MERLLITQSLISAWNYVHDCFESQVEDAYDDFVKTLKREPKETTPEMQNGIDFENEVYKEVNGFSRVPHPSWEKGINAVATIINGSPLQVKAQAELTVDSYDLVVYGIMDAVKAGTIYDVKFVNKKFNGLELAGKYLNSPQHPAYLFILPEAREFKYLVSDGEDLYIETYTRKNTRPFEDIAREFLNSIRDMGLMPLYLEKWVAK